LTVNVIHGFDLALVVTFGNMMEFDHGPLLAAEFEMGRIG
jgi:hypothetical protein